MASKHVQGIRTYWGVQTYRRNSYMPSYPAKRVLPLVFTNSAINHYFLTTVHRQQDLHLNDIFYYICYITAFKVITFWQKVKVMIKYYFTVKYIIMMKSQFTIRCHVTMKYYIWQNVTLRQSVIGWGNMSELRVGTHWTCTCRLHKIRTKLL